MRERPNRSDSYQYLIHEISVSDDFLNCFTNDSSTSHYLNPFIYSEEYLELKDELKKEFWILAKKVCTPHQYEIIRMVCDGYTQTEIAKILKVQQSSVTKSINGNCDYSKGKKIYGGLIKKMKKHAEEHKRIQEILSRMVELQEEKL